MQRYTPKKHVLEWLGDNNQNSGLVDLKLHNSRLFRLCKPNLKSQQKGQSILNDKWSTLSSETGVWQIFFLRGGSLTCSPCVSKSSALIFIEIGTEMSEVCSFQIGGSRVQNWCHNCLICRLSLKFDMSIAHSFLHRFPWKKMHQDQNHMCYRLNTLKKLSHHRF